MQPGSVVPVHGDRENTSIGKNWDTDVLGWITGQMLGRGRLEPHVVDAEYVVVPDNSNL